MALDLISASNDYIQIGIWSFDDKPYAESSDVGNTSGWGLNNNWRNLTSEIGKVHTGLEITGRAAVPAHLSGKAGLWLKDVGAKKHLYGLDVDGIILDENFRIGQHGGLNNTLIGVDSGYSLTTGNSNVFVGYRAGSTVTTGYSDVFVGRNAGSLNMSGYDNVFIGAYSGAGNNSGKYNVFMGKDSGMSSDSDNNTFIGYQAGYNNTTADNNTFIGYQAGYNNTTIDNNTFIGYQAGYNNIDRGYNTFIGYQSGYNNIGGGYNTFIGRESGYSNISGGYNTFIGLQAGHDNISGESNVIIGMNSLGKNITGHNNIAVGNCSLYWNTAGNNNTAIGDNSLNDNTVGNYNTAIGSASLNVNTVGNNNTAIGRSAGHSSVTGDGNVFIGNQAGYSDNTSNKLYIANSDTVTPLIYGEFDTPLLRFHTDNIEIGANIKHIGDTNNLIAFGTDTQDYQTGGSSRLDISDAGVRLGGANSRVTTILDEDAMGTDSATALATQQSIKAYVDTQVATKIANVVDDTTPQLGGDLDMNAKGIDFPTTANVTDCKDEDDMASDSATMLATQQSIKAFGEGLVTIVGVSGTKVADITEADTNWHFLDLSAYVTTRCTAVVLIVARRVGTGSFLIAPYEGTLDAPVNIYAERALFDIKDGGQRVKYRQSTANDDFDVYLLLKMDSE